MKALFDTNVLLAAFLTEGLCSILLIRARRGEFELFVCPEILIEFERVMLSKIKVPREAVREAMELILEAATKIEPATTVEGICRDKNDDHVLACAISAGVDYLVTGDKDLLEIETINGIKIVPPREFEALFEN